LDVADAAPVVPGGMPVAVAGVVDALPTLVVGVPEADFVGILAKVGPVFRPPKLGLVVEADVLAERFIRQIPKPPARSKGTIIAAR
jgi:hypothetical protein